MKLIRVRSKKELAGFIELPYRLHKNEPNWIAPLKMMEWDTFLGVEQEHALFMVEDEGEVVGRIAAFVDRKYDTYHPEENAGFWGSFESVDDEHVMRMLMDAALEWLSARGKTLIRGPINFVSQSIGFVVEGFDVPPSFMSPFNPPYYLKLPRIYDMRKGKDADVFLLDGREVEYNIPERFVRAADGLQKKYGIVVRSVDPRHLEKDIRIINHISNVAFRNQWGFIPVSEYEAEKIASDVKLIMDPETITIAEVGGKPIAYQITFPDLNEILRDPEGRITPGFIFRYIRFRSAPTKYRVWALAVMPEWQRRAVDVLLYVRLYQALEKRKRKIAFEINWVFEDNKPMYNAVEKLGFSKVKRYRVYELSI